MEMFQDRTRMIRLECIVFEVDGMRPRRKLKKTWRCCGQTDTQKDTQTCSLQYFATTSTCEVNMHFLKLCRDEM